MTPHAQPGPTSVPPAPPPPRRRRGRWVLAGVALALLAAGAALAWWRFGPGVAVSPEPPMPPDIEEAEVRDAIEGARQHVLKDPRSADAWGLLGMTLLAHLFDREADRCFAEAARLDPSDGRWPYARGLIALKRDPEHAVGHLRRAAACPSSPEDQASYRMELADALLEREERDEAETLYRDELRRQPDDARAAYGLGLIAANRGEADAAEQHLTTARGSQYARRKATVQLAALARGRGDEVRAAALDKEIADLPGDPPWPDPIYDRILELEVGRRRREREVTRLEQEHRYQEAVDIYLQQIRVDPNDATAYTGAGFDMARLKDYDRAFGLLREGVKMAPDDADAHYALALALYSRAEDAWQRAPGDSQLKGWFGEAARHAERAATLRPDHGKAYLFWGLSLKYLGRPADAVAPLRKGVECHPEDLELQLGLGEALVEAGQAKEAEAYLENAHRIGPDDPRPTRDLERLRPK